MRNTYTPAEQQYYLDRERLDRTEAIARLNYRVQQAHRLTRHLSGQKTEATSGFLSDGPTFGQARHPWNKR